MSKEIDYARGARFPNIRWPETLTLEEDSLWGSSVNIGTIQRRLASPLRKDDTHKSRSVNKLGPWKIWVGNEAGTSWFSKSLPRPRVWFVTVMYGEFVLMLLFVVCLLFLPLFLSRPIRKVGIWKFWSSAQQPKHIVMLRVDFPTG